MTTESQVFANRANAQRSTGPSTPQGRKKVSMNAVKHNFCGQTCVVPEHEMEAYEKHFESFRKEFRPVGPSEEFLVQSLAELTWTTQQIRAMMASKISLSATRVVPQAQTAPTPELSDAITRATSLDEMAPSLNTLGIYEQRKVRLFLSTRKELVQIQATRKAQEQQEMTLAAALRKNDLETRQPNEPAWDPKQNGFVYSIAQIDDFLAQEKRLDRLNLHKKAAA
jgi:hypothetical protein